MARRKGEKDTDFTRQYLDGGFDADESESGETFGERLRDAQQGKMLKTALARAEEPAQMADLEKLPVGEVVQVFSMFCDVECEGRLWLCVTRKTLRGVSGLDVIVGDLIRFRDTGIVHETGRPEAVIEQILPRRTILTRSDSFNAVQQDPIVANAKQMLIVVSLRQPEVKWGLVDRMLVAAEAGKLRPIVCLNKIDLAHKDAETEAAFVEAIEVLAHYQRLGVTALQTSIDQQVGLDALLKELTGTTTVLAGHSGVGKSSLIHAVQPHLDLKIGRISMYHEKGMHTTSSARRYPLDTGGFVIDTPGVKMFGLWGVTAENLEEYFPDITDGTAPAWRKESYQRILESIPKPQQGNR